MLGAESAVVILDDTEGVWPRHAANLVHVRIQIADQPYPITSVQPQDGSPAVSACSGPTPYSDRLAVGMACATSRAAGARRVITWHLAPLCVLDAARRCSYATL